MRCCLPGAGVVTPCTSVSFLCCIYVHRGGILIEGHLYWILIFTRQATVTSAHNCALKPRYHYIKLINKLLWDPKQTMRFTLIKLQVIKYLPSSSPNTSCACKSIFSLTQCNWKCSIFVNLGGLIRFSIRLWRNWI